MEKNLKFIDAKGVKFSINIKVTEKDLSKTLDYETLKPCSSKSKVLSITGECGFSCGQVYDSINPCTVAQQRLVDFWKKYHLNDCISGTKKQMDYLENQYKNEFELIKSSIEDIHYKTKNGKEKALKSIIEKIGTERFNAGVKFDTFLFVDYVDKAHLDINDYYLKNCILMLAGLYEDNGYKYGTRWLYKSFDENELNDIINDIKEENKVSEIDINDTSISDKDLVFKIADIKKIDTHEAKCLLAIARAYDHSWDEIISENTSSDWNTNEYSISGIEYYAGNENDLNEIAVKYLINEDCYWRDAVKAKATNLGLKEWAKYVVDTNGFSSVLNTWDGKSEDECVLDTYISMCRK